MNPMVEAGKGAIILTFLIWLSSITPFPFNVIIVLACLFILGSMGFAIFKTRDHHID